MLSASYQSYFLKKVEIKLDRKEYSTIIISLSSE